MILCFPGLNKLKRIDVDENIGSASHSTIFQNDFIKNEAVFVIESILKMHCYM